MESSRQFWCFYHHLHDYVAYLHLAAQLRRVRFDDRASDAPPRNHNDRRSDDTPRARYYNRSMSPPSDVSFRGRGMTRGYRTSCFTASPNQYWRNDNYQQQTGYGQLRGRGTFRGRARPYFRDNTPARPWLGIYDNQLCWKCERRAHLHPNLCPAINLNCRGCERKGHFLRVCRSSAPNQMMSDWRQTGLRVVKGRKFCSTHSEHKNPEREPRPDGNYVTMKINHASIDAMIDTGAVHTLLSESVARILRLKVLPLQRHDHSVMIAANGSKLELIEVKCSICSFWKTRLKFITLYAIFFPDRLYIGMRYLYRYVPCKSMIANI